MVFSSITFLFFFLPVAVGVAVVLPHRLRNFWLLVCSWFFYVWGSGALVLLLIASTAVDYGLGRAAATGRSRGNGVAVKAAVVASVALNLTLLASFKYANFLVEQLNALGFGNIAQTSITLPIGISFFTFQSMSYTIDVARGRADHLRNPIDFALYVSLFPQLVAGPIVRFHELSAQLKNRRISVDGVSDGAVRFTHGLAKKVLVADTIAPIADIAFSNAGSLSSPAAWIGVLAYTMQIYFDFSGYSDMAIGLGQMLGFSFPENFRRPYSAVSVTDFWRRWHITLSNWFRDYLYVPLGGSRRGPLRTYVNLSIVFVLTGLWHGANWTFVVWGIFHGTLLIVERASGQRPTDERPTFAPCRRALVFIAVMLGWVLFRAADLGAAGEMFADMFTGGLGGQTGDFFDTSTTMRAKLVLMLALTSVALPARFVSGLALTSIDSTRGQILRTCYLGAVLPASLTVVATSTFSPFLYFQF